MPRRIHMTVKTVSIESIRADIEALRQEKVIGNEAANLASVALELQGDDAILANRLIVQGSDPLSIQLAATGEVSESVRAAHFQGPGSLKGDDKTEWLALASVSLDESQKTSLSVGEKVKQFLRAVQWFKGASDGEKRRAAHTEEKKIKALPYRTAKGCHLKVETRIYESDRGFAAAYWSGCEHAAVKSDDGLLFVGSQDRPLSEIGIEVDKELSPQFGIIFP